MNALFDLLKSFNKKAWVGFALVCIFGAIDAINAVYGVGVHVPSAILTILAGLGFALNTHKD